MKGGGGERGRCPCSCPAKGSDAIHDVVASSDERSYTIKAIEMKIKGMSRLRRGSP